jgi:hypothetical protein
MGPWSHGQWAFGKSNNLGNIYWGFDANNKFQTLEKKFFDFYLKGEGKDLIYLKPQYLLPAPMNGEALTHGRLKMLLKKVCICNLQELFHSLLLNR